MEDEEIMRLEINKNELKEAFYWLQVRKRRGYQLIALVLPMTIFALLMSYYKITQGWVPNPIILSGFFVGLSSGLVLLYLIWIWFLSDYKK